MTSNEVDFSNYGSISPRPINSDVSQTLSIDSLNDPVERQNNISRLTECVQENVRCQMSQMSNRHPHLRSVRNFIFDRERQLDMDFKKNEKMVIFIGFMCSIGF